MNAVGVVYLIVALLMVLPSARFLLMVAVKVAPNVGLDVGDYLMAAIIGIFGGLAWPLTMLVYVIYRVLEHEPKSADKPKVTR